MTACPRCGQDKSGQTEKSAADVLVLDSWEPGPLCARCAAEAEPAGPSLVDGRYRIERELGHGGMGIVYLATDLGLQRFVALKMIAPKWTTDPEWAAALQKEAVAIALIRNQHVVQVYAFGRHEDSYFFAMEYVRGRSLRQILFEHRRHRETIPVHRSLTILARIADAVEAVHATGFVHRDIKPDNVVIEEDTGRPVLVDFGLAVPSATRPESFDGGTPDYMAPEQSWFAPEGSEITSRTDIYSLGCVAFEMLSGELPFATGNPRATILAHVRTPARSISSVRADLAPFDPVLRRALAKGPADRFESCAAFIYALSEVGAAWQHRDGIEAEPIPAPSIRTASSGRRVLVVDDDPNFLKFATRAVQLAFYGAAPRIAAVSSGAAALASAARASPDLVLLDFDMPGLDGVDTLSHLRALPHGDRARVVVLSGKVGDADKWRFSVLGVNEFVRKPIDLEALVASITAIAVRAGWSDAGEVAAALP